MPASPLANSDTASRPRIAETVASLSLATDLGMGLPMEHALRTCLLALRLGEALGLRQQELREVYYVALLRRIGCTSDSHELTEWFADDLAAHSRLFEIDFGRPVEVLLDMMKYAGAGRPALGRASAVVNALSSGRDGVSTLFRSACEVAERLARRLGFGDGIASVLTQTFERWDGRGFPSAMRSEGIALSARVVQVAEDAEVLHGLGGIELARAAIRHRAGKAYDPTVANTFLGGASELFQALEVESAWRAVLDAEPGPSRALSGDEFDQALEAFADFTDLKSLYTTGHSRGGGGAGHGGSKNAQPFRVGEPGALSRWPRARHWTRRRPHRYLGKGRTPD
jgi:hypothetical protein